MKENEIYDIFLRISDESGNNEKFDYNIAQDLTSEKFEEAFFKFISIYNGFF